MFGFRTSFHRGPHAEGRSGIDLMSQAVAIGLVVPLTCAVVGGLIGGFSAALLGFALGLGTCVVSVMVLMLLTSG